MPEKRLPLLEAAGHDLMAQIEAMAREVQHYQREVVRIRDVFDRGDREQASHLVAEAPVITRMQALREESLALADTIESIEMFVREEQEARG